MRAAESLIAEIVASSQIPSSKRRREVARELRSHVEDFVQIARQSGQADDEIERTVLASFGNPRQIGLSFAWVYRRERALLRLWVFGISTVAVAIAISATILAMQTGAAFGSGVPIMRVLGSRHTMIEVADIFATVAVYVGFLSLQNLFERNAFAKTTALLALLIAILMCAAAVGWRAPFLVSGFVIAIFLRSVQEFVRSWTSRLALVLACFWIFGYFVTAYPASWLMMGIGYQLMTSLAARVDHGLFEKLQRI